MPHAEDEEGEGEESLDGGAGGRGGTLCVCGWGMWNITVRLARVVSWHHSSSP